MKKILFWLIPLCLALASCGQKIDPSRVVANPVNVQYAFHRQAAPREIPAEMLARMTPEQRTRMAESARRQAEAARRTSGAREGAGQGPLRDAQGRRRQAKAGPREVRPAHVPVGAPVRHHQARYGRRQLPAARPGEGQRRVRPDGDRVQPG